ncbi:MAG: adenylate/guanylate cyclase domain-containing protein, partial [Acidimicrobiales bacterium]
TQPRGGLVFGEVLFRHGDYYGPVVNMAARLVDAAIPGEALVDGSVVEATKDETLVFEPAGRRMLKGFEAPVAVWSLIAEA